MREERGDKREEKGKICSRRGGEEERKIGGRGK
jgi:hypothetical protein